MTGVFVAVEGIDRSGKTTLTASLARSLRQRGLTVRERTEPSRGPVGQLFREMSSGQISPMSAALLSAADRHDQQDPLARDLAAADVVISDRYYLSGLAYHLVDGVPTTFYRSLNTSVRRPDLYLYLVIDWDVAQRRRGRHDGRWEEPSFATRVPRGYDVCARELATLEHARLARIDAARPAAAVQHDALAAIASALPERNAA